MRSVTRRRALGLVGAALGGFLAGCNQTPPPQNTTHGATTSTFDAHTTEDVSSSTESTPQTLDVSTPHPIPLKLWNVADEPLQLTVTVTQDVEVTHRSTVAVPAGKATVIDAVYTAPETDTSTYTTTIHEEDRELGSHDITVKDYHHLHAITTEINRAGVAWNHVIH